MTTNVARSKGGAFVRRYDGPTAGFELAGRDEDSRQQVEAHCARHFGRTARLLSDPRPDVVSIDFHLVEPTAARDHYTVYTVGMSDSRMHPPSDFKRPDQWWYAELMLGLPPDWFTEPASRNFSRIHPRHWPLQFLLFLARFPHLYETFFGEGHTIPNGDPPEPLSDDTRLAGALLQWPRILPEDGHELILQDGRLVSFYAVVAVYPEEMEFALARGLKELQRRFAELGVSEVIDPRRPSAV